MKNGAEYQVASSVSMSGYCDNPTADTRELKQGFIPSQILMQTCFLSTSFQAFTNLSISNFFLLIFFLLYIMSETSYSLCAPIKVHFYFPVF